MPEEKRKILPVGKLFKIDISKPKYGKSIEHFRKFIYINVYSTLPVFVCEHYRSVRYASLWFPIWFLSSNARLAMECCWNGEKRGLGCWLFCSGKHQSSNWTKMNTFYDSIVQVFARCMCGWFDILVIARCGRGCYVLCIHGV